MSDPGPLEEQARGPTAFGQALAAYHEGVSGACLEVRWDVADPYPLPVEVFFAAPSPDRPITQGVMENVRGSVLDVGAAAGRYSVLLAEAGYAVTALEMLPQAVEILRARGVRTLVGDLFELNVTETFDTVLVMMNGTSLAGTLARLEGLLARLDAWASAGGTILIDSTDPLAGEGEWDVGDDGRYPGELHLQLGFDGHWDDPIPQLYVDPETLEVAASKVGLDTAVVARGEEHAYLAKLTRR